MAKYDIVLNIKVDQELKNAIEKLADEQDVTTSALIRSVLYQFIKKETCLSEKQAYYYDHLLNEIINNKDRLEKIEFISYFGTNPSIKIDNRKINNSSLTREYIEGLLQLVDFKVKHPVVDEFINSFTTISNIEQEDFEDIEDGLANVVPSDEKTGVEIIFPEHQEDQIDINSVEPRKIVKHNKPSD